MSHIWDGLGDKFQADGAVSWLTMEEGRGKDHTHMHMEAGDGGDGFAR